MDHKELDVWKKSIELVETIYKISAQFPASEIYGLTNQIRRASVSISSNIAEGAGRSSDKELLYFLNVALGSLAEVETQVEIALRLNFISTADIIFEQITEVRKLIIGFRNYIKKKSNH
ncbi:four helix bundle protein [Christiangramia sp. OXR-203]|uniref:four helix bundle protein n=1 Tax=Christiangramia sp. OXR-203 TaxID=3100176 RepID=UPI002AC8D00C|nr:four helix bundle protein [Christiangramia sp. OXR-203]WPY97917.1 four helix bundle protein [Christiangramia sp. OXR-203]